MRTLIAYFSASGVTAQVAEQLAAMTGGDLERIEPIPAYTEADLDWRNKQSRSTREMTDESSRPAIAKPVHDLEEYDVIFIGYPIWWGVEPRPVDTYLDLYSLKGRRIVPFATSGGSGVSESVRHLRSLYPDANIEEGLLLNSRIDEKKIREIIDR